MSSYIPERHHGVAGANYAPIRYIYPSGFFWFIGERLRGQKDHSEIAWGGRITPHATEAQAQAICDELNRQAKGDTE